MDNLGRAYKTRSLLVYYCRLIVETAFSTEMDKYATESSHDEHVDRQIQDRRNSIANALKSRLSCTNPSIWSLIITGLI